ncbi:MAG: hypothetical protein GX550_07330 [Syntrophomonadaceae bacterium]|nr:hypothetical protein [Syntrophomonadaceae bacterium]
MANILIVHAQATYPVRTTSWDNLYCFRRYSGHKCYYLNLAFNKAPRYLKYIDFDLIIFHDLFVCARWAGKARFDKLMQRAEVLKGINIPKVVLPQDEFIFTDLLCDFINEFGISHVFSVSPSSEWRLIYDKVNFDSVKFHPVLTGYLDEKTVAKINLLSEGASSDRSIDIGYRARYHNPWIGRHGMLKSTIGDVFAAEGARRGLRNDISMKEEDAFIGDDWYRFLLNCKYTIGVEGGASILDRDGSIMERTERYLKGNPEASFEQVEAACFPGRDGELKLFAISPRHLEACATRTCQILIEGSYNDILKPGEHYIELKADFSNLEQVLDQVVRDDVRQAMTDHAYADIVSSGRYNYQSYVDFIIDHSLSDQDQHGSSPIWYSIMRIAEIISWGKAAVFAKSVNKAKQLFPQPLIDWLKKLRN